ncbi:hypothetical protein MTR_4g094320 [Medicago truncatula]|uniref:Uncharacterized protein n=1 Tax=Medicago truncatula TaxID=3880 RepID=A0A072UPF5_MEDTR|nr:hypothetical protein MTR_4g094320 [Medicago truncatula]
MVAVAQLIKIFHIMCQNHRKRNPLHIFPVKKTRATRLTTFPKIQKQDSQIGIILLKPRSSNEKKQNSTFGPPSWYM